MEPTFLSPEQRQEILDQIQRREALEAQAKREQQAALKAEAERTHAESLAAELNRREEERRRYILGLLQQSFDGLGRAIAAFSEQNNETECYRLMAGLTGNLNLAMQRLTRPTDNSRIAGSLPTIKIVADNPSGWAIINLEDFVEPLHRLYEEGN